MKKSILKISIVTIMLFVFQTTLSTLWAQPVPATNGPVGSIINIGQDSEIKFWNGSVWVIVAPDLPGKSLLFVSGIPSWVNNPQGITTTNITSINGNFATSGGTILSDGGASITSRGVCWSTSPNPTIADSKTTDGMGIGNYTSNITGLTESTTYFLRAYATNSAGTAYGDEFSFGSGIYYPVYDLSGNGYNTVIIGSQIWLKENLKTTTYNDGSSIDWPFTNVQWLNNTSGAYAYYLDNQTFISTHGNLYNWYAVNTNKLCPTGFRVPSNTDWDILTNYMGGENVAAANLRNQTDFTPLAGGYRDVGGSYSGIYSFAYWWSSNSGSPTVAYSKKMDASDALIANAAEYGKGYSVRCMRTAQIPTVTTVPVTNITYTNAVSGGNIIDNGGIAIIEKGVCWSTLPNPTKADSNTSDGVGMGAYVSNLSLLNPNTTYYVRAYASNLAGTAYGNEISFTTGTLVTDFDGNIYDTVHIGTQVWLKQNLNSSFYKDGTPIPNITDNAVWSGLNTGARCYYNNDSATYAPVYGALYNWYAVNTSNLCPTNWHVPSYAEWTTLRTYLGDNNLAGGKLKETGLSHWLSPNINATNETGFTALPAGYRDGNGVYFHIGNNSFWWNSNEYNATEARMNLLSNSSGYINFSLYGKMIGSSVRCLKD
jgi:uncharacterized protein (TIGR02145 family)